MKAFGLDLKIQSAWALASLAVLRPSFADPQAPWKSPILSPTEGDRGRARAKGKKGRTEKPKLFSFALFLLPFDLFFSLYFLNSKFGMAAVTLRRKLYFESNEDFAGKMTIFALDRSVHKARKTGLG